jgi:hypothetical protein
VQRRSFFWVGTAVLVAIVGLGITPAQAQTRSKAKPKPRPKTTLVKRASSARQRSIATTREMNNTVVPR